MAPQNRVVFPSREAAEQAGYRAAYNCPLMNIDPKLLVMNEKKGLLERLVADLNRDVPNLEATVERVSIEAIEMAGIVQSSFAEFNSLMLLALSEQLSIGIRPFTCTISTRRSFARRALREALCSYYGAAGSLLRSACEAILRGAFWECLAHGGIATAPKS